MVLALTPFTTDRVTDDPPLRLWSAPCSSLLTLTPYSLSSSRVMDVLWSAPRASRDGPRYAFVATGGAPSIYLPPDALDETRFGCPYVHHRLLFAFSFYISLRLCYSGVRIIVHND